MTLIALDGGQSSSAAEWDGRAELWLGSAIRNYLVASPPSLDSTYAHDLETWARNLADAGRERLEFLGLPGRTLTIATQEVAP